MRYVIRLVTLMLLVALATAATVHADPRHEQLWQAARDGDVAQVKSLLDGGVPVDVKTEFDCTALYFAANSNRTDVMKVLLAAGADVDVRDNSYGFSAVGMAAWLGHAAAVEVLIGAGADPGDATGALFAAIGNGHLDVVEVGLKTLEIDPAQLTAMLATAERSGQDAVADRLRKAGAKAPEPTTESADASPPDATPEPASEAPPIPEIDSTSLQRPEPVRAAPWPEFRGPGRSGIADGQHPPLAFDLDTERNIRWRRPIEGLGLSSPIVWGHRVFVTTAISPETEQSLDAGALGNIDPMSETSRHDWRLIAVDLHSGRPIWQQTAFSGVPRSQRHWKASQANPTAVTDGEVVVAFFGSAGLHAFDLDGKRLWQQDLGRLDAGWYMDPAFEWGFASSPILDGDRVIVQSDVHGSSFVAAYDKATGKQQWRTERDELPSWGTPLVYRDDRHAELILAATNAIVGYDPADGKELWRLAGNSPITVASPIARDGLIVATGGYRTPKPIYAIKPGGRGDITPEKDAGNAHVAWSTQTDGAYQVTPLLYRGVLYVCRDHGVLTAYDPVSGEQLYRQRLRGRFTASPVAADGRIYFTAEDGDVTVVQAGRTFRVLARSALDATSLATPAISDGLLIFRTVNGLIGVGLDRREPSSQPAP